MGVDTIFRDLVLTKEYEEEALGPHLGPIGDSSLILLLRVSHAT